MQTSMTCPNVKRMTFTYTKNDEGLFVCPTCQATKKNQSTMFYHMKRHQEEFSHVCKICDKGFLQKHTLDLHTSPSTQSGPRKRRPSCARVIRVSSLRSPRGTRLFTIYVFIVQRKWSSSWDKRGRCIIVKHVKRNSRIRVGLCIIVRGDVYHVTIK